MNHKEQKCRWMNTKLVLLISSISYGTVHYVASNCLRQVDSSMETGSRNTILRNFKKENLSNTITSMSYTHEAKVFRSLLGRVTAVTDGCGAMGEGGSKLLEKELKVGTVTLPEHGIQPVLKKWLLTHDYKNNRDRDYPMCQLPPPKSCNVTSYSVIIMSHTVNDPKRLGKMLMGMQSLAYRPGTAEIILVWNADREVLANETHKYAQKLRLYADDPKHPLRIFYSLENGLENNLLNRYNPAIKPTQELIMYFDDDGPFMDDAAMTAGLKLWQFNSDTQVGSMPRNLRLTSDRMRSIQKSAAKLAASLANKDAWQTHVSPNDELRIAAHEDGSASNGFPAFIPLCHSKTGDAVKYNYNHFPSFEAHMFLPSGTLLHRNYLCFIWHPVFAELRQFILDHPTHPDDMVISTLVSHLSGKGLRSFPRRIIKRKNENPAGGDKRKPEDSVGVDQSRRRLLWQQDMWGDMREDAINLILNYFGSINPGSLGWCTGTQYFVEGGKNSESLYKCDPEYPRREDIPWMNEGGLGYNQCHV